MAKACIIIGHGGMLAEINEEEIDDKYFKIIKY